MVNNDKFCTLLKFNYYKLIPDCISAHQGFLLFKFFFRCFQQIVKTQIQQPLEIKKIATLEILNYFYNKISTTLHYVSYYLYSY